MSPRPGIRRIPTHQNEGHPDTMTPAVPSPKPAARYYAEFRHGLWLTRPGAGTHREDSLTIIDPATGPDSVARFTARTPSGGMAADDLLKAHAWRPLGPWEYYAEANLYRARVEPARPLITAGQAAVRAAEQHGSPETVAGLDRALCALPLTDMDDQADRILHQALKAVTHAEDAEEWQLLAAAQHAVTRLTRWPDDATLGHPAVRAVGELALRCSLQHDQAEDTTTAAAWNRGYLAGMETLSAVTALLHGSPDSRAVGKAMARFEAAVRRAIPYTALYETRRALVEAARTYNLFVIGMRQPPPPNSRWTWARRIGTAVYLFQAEPPLTSGRAVAVCRTAQDGTVGPVRYFPLSADPQRRRAVTEACFRI
ncbi:hypothetical protein AB0B04_18890 [Streptomyces xinghaiensis]|uniref:Uncharacterized protein n=2 Tax=Streptomyces TaxID=1883 RepID=A0A420UY02_9ACTN|nr:MULTISPECIES: hypothetical protein [Streptomyces]KNE78795.1 hypothetical protein ADZ36_31280 [Streptomyces fradiae]OFA36654.1 hypothetical protein BEN35_29805 [Streptomyces fradiae]RKM92591.1 hypothetical protein SFRA_024710 [Streptomyces xinghaiensis]RNC70559.1 hypothetical protein DC095_025700 [Streptomyces xinghaiensis]